MRFERMITAVDCHTEGEPARVVTGGVPHIPGETMFDKKLWAEEHLDELRTMLMFEPRGHSSMSGSIITTPCSPEADIGVLFIEVTGFLPMCGHASIATCTVLVETGIIEATEPITEMTIDTPAGIVKAEVAVEGGVAQNVTIRNVPSFLYKGDVEVEVPTLGRLALDIAWGGDFYAILPAASVGSMVDGEHVKQLIDYGTKIREAVFEQVEVAHPQNPAINICTQVRFTGPPRNPKAMSRNVVFYGVEGLDRSPCGTGTSAEMATLYARGQLGLGEEYVSESIVGSLFYGRLIKECEVGGYPAVIPAIRGSAYITGIQQFVLDPRDPWPRGFYLGPRSKWGTAF